METRNLLSVHQGSVALETVGAGKEYKILKENEIKTLQLFCDEMKKYGCDTKDLDGYFVGYTIDQMGKEFDLLSFLYKNKGIVFTRKQLLNEVWGYDYYGDTRTVDVHIRRLRSHLGENKDDSIIDTVFGVGYVLK